MEEESKTKFSMNVEFSFAFKKNNEITSKQLTERLEYAIL